MNKKRLITILAICGGLLIIGGSYSMYSSLKKQQDVMAQKIKAQEELLKVKEKEETESKQAEEVKQKEELAKQEAEKKKAEETKQKEDAAKKQAEEKAKQQKANTPSKVYGCSVVDDNAESVKNLTIITGSLIESVKNVTMLRGDYERGGCDFNTLATAVKSEFKTVCNNMDALDIGHFANGKTITIPSSQVQTFKNVYSIGQQLITQLDDMFHTDDCRMPAGLSANLNKLTNIQQSNVALCNKYGVTGLAG